MTSVELTQWEITALLNLCNLAQVQGKENLRQLLALIEKLEKATGQTIQANGA